MKVPSSKPQDPISDVGQIGRCHSCVREPCPTPKIKARTPERGCAQWTDGVPKCVYLVREDGMAEGGVWQRECGMAATHRAERNRQLTLCGRHAAEVEKFRKFKIRLLNEEQPVSQNEPTNL